MSEYIAICLISVPFAIWYIIGIRWFGWKIPTLIYVAFGCLIAGLWLLK